MPRQLYGAALDADTEAYIRTGMTKEQRDAFKAKANARQRDVNSWATPNARISPTATARTSKNDTKPDKVDAYNKKGQKVKKKNNPKHKRTVGQNLADILFKKAGVGWRDRRKAEGLPTG